MAPNAEDIALSTPKTDGTVRTLIRTYGLVRRVMEPYFARFGVSNSQWGVLRALHRAEGEGLTSLRLTDLGDRLLVRPPSVTGIVDRLHRMGLLRRIKSADDHRAKEVSLTPAGRERVKHVLEHLPAQLESVLGGLTADDRKQLQRLLDGLAQRLETLATDSEGGESKATTKTEDAKTEDE